MKPTQGERDELRRRVLEARGACGLSNAQIAAATGVDPGQVSKICRGRFETVNDSLVKICNVLGFSLVSELAASAPVRGPVAAESTDDAAAWRRLETSVRRAWDNTPEGAARLARVLDAIAEAIRR